MSLAEQSLQWFPTSVQVTVHQARNLRAKGKNGTNDSYAIIQVAKDKFSTSVAEKSVAPVWKEEASFDLPLFHPGNAERCTLYIIVMHRAQVGLDKFLGQAVVNLLDLHDNKARKKTDWFKLVDKHGKEDKDRGEVLLDIQFMRNNMSASMFDLSMQDKPRSRISKIKDKVRGKKKDGLSDSASAIVAPVSQVLTDSEGEADAQSLNQSPGVKKKSKIKSLFAPKSNLHRNISQSMSTLGTLPEKNSSLSGSRSSGLNVDTPEVKKKFKFLGHKRTGSSDSKVSQGPFSLLGRSKQTNNDVNNLCINGSHVYTEESEPKSESALSLNSSGQGSVEDVSKHTSDVSAVSFVSVPHPTYRNESTDRALVEQQRHQEEERRLAEEKRTAEAKRVEEEEKHRAELKRLQEEEERKYQEEQERKRRFLEDEARRKRQEEEEEDRRRQEEELQAAEKQRLEEEHRKLEEQKRQEEASMTDRLSTLFGIIRKKEEKKEEVQHPKEELPTPAPQLDSRNLNQPKQYHSTNPFEEIPLSSEPTVGNSESLADQQIASLGPQIPSASVFLSRTAKVSAVKPRLNQSLEFEPPECQTLSQLSPSSPTSPESTFCSIPESPDTFSSLHFSLAPPSPSLSSSPFGSTENLSSVGSSPTMAEKKRKALLPPKYPAKGNQTGGNQVPELNHTHIEADGSKQGKKMSLPLPDYETLFPHKRHGVQGQTKWDHIIAEVNQKHRDGLPELVGPEVSVDGPGEREPSPWSSSSQESPATRVYQTPPVETKPMSSKKVAAPAPPKAVTSPHLQAQPETIQRQNQMTAHQSVIKPNTLTVEAPTAKPRQRVNGKEPIQQEDSAVTPDDNKNSKTQTLLNQSMRSMDKNGDPANKNFAEFDLFSSSELLSQDPWAIHEEDDELFTGNTPIKQKPENQGMTPDDLDKIFSQEKPTDPFASFNSSESNKRSEHDTVDVGFHIFQRRNSQRQKQATSKSQSDDKALKSQQEPANKEVTSKTEPNQSFKTSDAMKESVKADVKSQRSLSRGEDPFESFTVPSVLNSSEPLSVVMEEPAEGLFGGKTVLQAWVSPSEAQPVSAQSSTGGGLAFTPRRPHPVKPLTTAESQHDTKVWDSTPGKIKVAGSSQSGPYTQLTQEELITLVVKQQTDLSKKDAKIVELEEYIDNLLLRVIEEKPSILQALLPPKTV